MIVKPGSTIGILGGGQLGRMMAGAAARLGFDTVIYCPENDPPAARVACQHVQADYDETAALEQFAALCDVVTYEFENVAVAAVETIHAHGTRVRPGGPSLAVSQDRAREKTFLQDAGIDTAPWREVDSAADLAAARRELGGETLLKVRREGYDGHGQRRVSQDEDAAAAWTAFGGHAAVLEAVMPFALEISVIIARGADGETAVWTPSENRHSAGMLRRSLVPAPVPPSVSQAARAQACDLAEALDHVGVLALEFFVMADDRLIANEFAPRVHNSGHWTPEACATGQFENHVRAVAGWPLGPVTRYHDVELVNLVGEEALRSPAQFGRDGVLTLYGKRAARPGRKMGHLVRRTGLARDPAVQ